MLTITGNPGIFKTMRIHLPNSAFLGNIDPFLRGFDPTSPDTLEVTSNDKWIAVHPIVISMVAALGMTVKPERIRCSKFEARSRHYLKRMGLFDALGVAPDISIVEHAPEGRFIPVTRIKTSEELSRFIAEMTPMLHLQTAPEHARTLGYIVSELVRNVLEHSAAEQGAVLCAQYYKKSNSIRFGIADTGVGVRETITRSHSAPTDLDAIRLALTPGITGATAREGGTAQNAGAGLFFIKSIASVNRDFFVLYSGSGFYKLLKKTAHKNLRLHADPFEDRHSKDGTFPHWKGTAVGVDITLDQTREFTQLLDAIRETFSAAVRERRREKLRRPRFL